MKKVLIVLLFICLFSCSERTKNTNTEQSQDAITNMWVYNSYDNQMDDTKTYTAEIVSNEVLKFKFPYNQNSNNKMHIGIRNQSGVNEVLLYVDEGQFIPDFTNSKGILIRFDSKEPINFSYTMPDDGSLNGVFISDAKTFIASIIESQKVTIQCPFYNEGNVTLTFDTSDLDWQH